MAVEIEPKLTIGDMLPALALPAPDGRSVSLWDYKGRRNTVLVFLPEHVHSDCVEFMRAIADSYSTYEADEAVVIAVVRGSRNAALSLRDELRPPFDILYDETGRIAAQYADQLPAVFVGDKFGELYAEWVAGPGSLLPSQIEILDTLDLINLECPECGARVEWG